jgi:anaerobic magnesium-protoporphyrin IX monomethyl ester cyclase
MRVIFVSFQENSDVIGLKYLHAYITSKGYDSSILLVPNTKPANVKAAIDYIIKCKPDVLCFSAMTYEIQRAKDFANVVRNRLHGCPIIFGGIHATSSPEDCLTVSDIVVRGEGEETLLELLHILDAADGPANKPNIAQVSGIVFKQGDELIHTTVRQPPQNLDSLPYPKHLPKSMYVTHRGGIHPITEPDIYKRYARYQGTFLSVLSSRGCPFSCKYCCNSILKSLYGKNKIRSRTPENVIDEILQEVRNFRNILYVNFQDDCFMMHPLEWIADFSEQYSKKIAIPFIVRTTPKHINREKLVLLKKAGLRWVFMGLQTGSDRINLEIYGRSATSQDFLNAANIVSELDLAAWYDVILDNPYETEEDHLRTIDVLLRTPRPFQLALYSLDFLPGTELRRQAIEDGIPIPEPGPESFTKFGPTMTNRYIRMTATLPPVLIRLLLRLRGTMPGKIVGIGFYFFSLILEPFLYLWLIYKSNDFRILRTIKVLKAFYLTAINKLLLRKQG